MDVSGRITAKLMDAGHPCRHDDDLAFHVLCEHKIMTHFHWACRNQQIDLCKGSDIGGEPNCKREELNHERRI
jgi:hypothetical protein